VLNTFKDHIANTFPYLQDNPVIIACSGGMDSVVLSHLCKASGLTIALAHCNFNLRGEESDGDANFVKTLCSSWSIPFFLKSFQTEKESESQKGSIQMLARSSRYEWFNQLLQETDYKYVLTAHHLDDSLETFVINLSRGTGIEGLKGIPAVQGNILRPLLPFSKKEIVAFAKNTALKWREDSSNASKKYLRNSIRHAVVPELKALHPSFLDNFAKTQHFLSESSIILEHHKLEIQTALLKKEGDVFKIDVAALTALQPLKVYLKLIFKEFGFTAWNDILNLTTTIGGKEVYSATHRLIRHRGHILLTKKTNQNTSSYSIAKGQGFLDEPVRLKIQEVSGISTNNKNTIYVDTEKLKFPLLLRKWKTGDYFYPFGMQGKKKLSKYFKDEKMSTLRKEAQWILYSEGNVIWIIGERADNRFRVTNDTGNITKLEVIT